MERVPQAPAVNEETRVFWDGAAQGRLMLPRCAACGRLHWYPRALCPFCFGDALEWQRASGRGTIYSFSVLRRAAVPYAIGYVTLEEGVRMLTNFVDCAFDELRCELPVSVVFKPAEDGTLLPMFRPA